MLAVGQEYGSRPERYRDIGATRSLVEKAVTIRSGDTRKAVIEILGQPDNDSVLMRKENDEVIGHSLRYDIVRWKRGSVNELHDQYIDVFLDKNNLVKSLSIRVMLDER